MTQITGLPTNIANLQNDKTYTLGEGEAIQRTGMGAGGKVARFFKESFNKGRVADRNTAVLNSMIFQMKAQYGQNSFSAADLTLPNALTTGKRAITGREIKDLAQIALNRVKVGMNIPAKTAICTSIKAALNANPPSPGALLNGIKNNVPQGVTPQYAKLLISESMGALSAQERQQLNALVTGQDMANVNGLLNKTEKMYQAGMTAGRTTEADKTFLTPKLAAVKDMQSLLGSVTEALRLANASGNNWNVQNGQGNPQPPPQITVGPGLYGVGNAPQALKAQFTTMGLEQATAVIKHLVPQEFLSEGFDNLLRNSPCGAAMLKNVTKDLFSGLEHCIFNALDGVVKRFSPEDFILTKDAPDRKTFLRSQRGAEFMRELTKAIRSEPLCSAFVSSIKLFSDTCRDGVKTHYPNQFQGAMQNIFNGGATLPYAFQVAAMANSTADPDVKAVRMRVALLTQSAFGETGTQTPLGNALAQLSGWTTMMTKPE